MKNNIRIKEIGVYHPENQVGNEEFIHHFKQQGQDVENLLKAIGRENRYIASDGETTVSMAIEATQKVLSKAGIKGEDLDMIVFSSGTPEYLFPPNSVIIHHAIKGKPETCVYDSNVACVGMVTIVDQVAKSMLNSPDVKYALVVGSEKMFHYSQKDNPFTYSNFGDASCAILLEKVEDADVGIMGSSYYTDSSVHDKVMFPACGLSNVFKEDVPLNEKLFKWENISAEQGYGKTASQIETLLQRHEIDKSNVKKYFCSQLSKRAMDRVLNELQEDLDKFYFVGDEFGYTGTTSPYIAMERAIEKAEIVRGDYVVFWSLGSGITTCAMLVRY